MAVWIVAVASVVACFLQFLTWKFQSVAVCVISVSMHIVGFAVLFLMGAGLEELMTVLILSLASPILFNKLLDGKGGEK